MSEQESSSAVQRTSENFFAPVQAPRLKSISRKGNQRFLEERTQYEGAVQAQPEFNPISRAGCFDAIFLRSLLRARVLGKEITEVSQLTDGMIKAKLTVLSSQTKAVSYDEALADIKRACSPDASESDARLHILMPQTSYIELCGHRGWKFYDNAQKTAMKHICSVLQPPELKSGIEDALKLGKNELEQDFFGYADFLADEAEICENFRPLRAYRALQ